MISDTKVKNYTDQELLERVASLPSFSGFPKGYWILGVQSDEDTFNKFDDKFYLYKGKQFIMVTTGTTNAGLSGLKHYNRYNSQGVAVIKTNEWYYQLWEPGYHRGRMKALRQVSPIKFYRDSNKDNFIEEIGKVYEGMIGINFHTVTYNKNLSFIRKLIGGWSVGCQVINNVWDYYRILDYTKKQERVDYCLIKEF